MKVAHYKKPWLLLVSVCLTRRNVVAKELTSVERRFAQTQDRVESENAVLSEYQYKKKLLQVTESNKTKPNLMEDEEKEILEATNELALMQDEEDAWKKELKNVKVASLLTTSESDLSSLNRKLADVLHFIVPDETILNEKTELYPYTDIRKDETLRTASERLLESHGIFGSRFLSNGPIGVLKVQYSEGEARGEHHQGAKIFFLKAQLTTSLASLPDSLPPHKWLSTDELAFSLNADYFKKVKPFAIA